MKKISVARVAKDLGHSEEMIRFGLRENKFPFGTAINPTGNRWRYIIYPNEYRRYVKGGKE